MGRGLTVLGIVAVFAACGPDFSGQYSGIVSETWTCANGSSGSTSDTFNWKVSQAGTDLTVATDFCGTLATKYDGDLARLPEATCQQYAGVPNPYGAPFYPTLVGGAMVFAGGNPGINRDIAEIDLTANISVYRGWYSGVCEYVATGALNRAE